MMLIGTFRKVRFVFHCNPCGVLGKLMTGSFHRSVSLLTASALGYALAMNFNIGSCKPSVWPRFPVASSASHSGASRFVAGFPSAIRLNKGFQCRLRGSYSRCGPPLVCIAKDSSVKSSPPTRWVAGSASDAQTSLRVCLHGFGIKSVVVFSDRQSPSCNLSRADLLGKTLNVYAKRLKPLEKEPWAKPLAG